MPRKHAPEAPLRRKIAFIGSHGVGKTVITFSLASRLRAMGIDCDVAYENSRSSPFPINEGTTLEGQLWILAAQWKAELEALLRAGLILCDRSVLDNYAYLVRACGRQEWLHPWIARWLETYDALFLVPIPRGRVIGDAMRATSPKFRREIQGILNGLLVDFGADKKLVQLPPERTLQMGTVMNELRARSIVPGTQKELL
jgi:nicotinamide riboside kinase